MKDIDDIRRDNLRRLEAECGGLSEAARLVGMSPAQFANLRDGAKDSKSGKRRGMRKDTARRIEQAADKPAGWLDVDYESMNRQLDDLVEPLLDAAHKAVRSRASQMAATFATAYVRAPATTRAAVELLLLPAAQREELRASNPLALHAIDLLETYAREALKLRKIA